MNPPLIQGAIDYAASHGARIIEAYPFINPGKKYRMVGEAFMGFASTFERLGFRPVSDKSKVRNIMRLYLHYRKFGTPQEGGDSGLVGGAWVT